MELALQFGSKSVLLFLFMQLLVAKSHIERTGDIAQIVIPLYGLYETFYYDDQEGRYQYAKSFASTWLITHTLKQVVNRTRPDGIGQNSLPSGHTSAAFSGAFFLGSRYDRKWWQEWGIYGLASFVGYSRLYANKHYLSDVLAGMGIAYLFNDYFVDGRERQAYRLLPFWHAYNNTYSKGVYLLWSID